MILANVLLIINGKIYTSLDMVEISISHFVLLCTPALLYFENVVEAKASVRTSCVSHHFSPRSIPDS